MYSVVPGDEPQSDVGACPVSTAYGGPVLSVEELLSQLDAAPKWVPRNKELTHTASFNALQASELLAEGLSEGEVWRFGVLQTIDDYGSALRRGGVDLASQVFDDEPGATGSRRLDTAFVAVAEYLALRDGWSSPKWVEESQLRVDDWFPAVPPRLRALARYESPTAFAKRGIFVTHAGLTRA